MTAKASPPLWLNVGCGEFPAPPPWVNLDRAFEGGPVPDVVCNVLDGLPYKARSVERVYLGHVLEHLEYSTEVPFLLADVKRVLTKTGTVVAVGPDLNRAIKLVNLGYQPESLLDDIRAGGGRWPGDAHLWDCTEEAMVAAFKVAGLPVEPLAIADVPEDWPITSRIGWQAACISRRVS